MKLVPFPLREGKVRHDSSDEVFPGFCFDTEQDFITSRTSSRTLHTDDKVSDWIQRHLATPQLQVEKIPLRSMSQWCIDPASGNIQHESGRFYSITGVIARHRTGSGDLEWDQPIVDQPEVGILGILAKKIDGVLHFCLQAKEEPGNINSVQLSPTVQATYSNYTRVHGGSSPPFLEYFLNPPREKVLFSKLQTEDGGRFLFKSNRNMIVLVDQQELPDLPDRFLWLTLGQISRLLSQNNLVHACTRSILSSLVFSSSFLHSGASYGQPPESLGRIFQWVDDQKAANHIFVKREGLKTLKDWAIDDDGFFSHHESRFFRVIGINVSSKGREVPMWSQPILANNEPGVIGILMRVVDGRRSFLMQAKPDVGNRSIIQIGPTVQFTPGNYLGNRKLQKPFLFDEFMGDGSLRMIRSVWQSEEGARFYQEQHLHRIMELPENVDLQIPLDFRWLSESQIRFFLHMGESVNSCARSILSCLL